MINDSSSKSDNAPKVSDEELAGRLQFCVSMLGGMTATRISQDIGVSISAVTKWLRSGRISRTHLVAFAYLYGISLEWLITGLGSMKPSSELKGSGNLVSIYPLEGMLCHNGVAVAASEDAVVGRAYMEEASNLYFGIEAHCPEIDQRLLKGKHFIFAGGDFVVDAPAPGRLVVVARKKGLSELMLRVVHKLPDDSLLYASASNCLPSYTDAVVDVVGVCERVVDSTPMFF